MKNIFITVGLSGILQSCHLVLFVENGKKFSTLSSHCVAIDWFHHSYIEEDKDNLVIFIVWQY